MKSRGELGRRSIATSVIAKVKPKTTRPNLYRRTDFERDYTPNEFVVRSRLFEQFFHKDVEAATKIMLHFHHQGIGECGVFPYEDRRDQGDASDGFARNPNIPCTA